MEKPSASVLAVSVAVAAQFAAVAGGFRSVTREDAVRGAECCVTGVVTMASSWQPNSCVIADPEDPNGAALYVNGTGEFSPDVRLEALASPLAIGQIIEVRGKAASMLFKPGIEAERIRFLGNMQLPEPPMRTLRDFAFGRLDNRRTALSGVLTDVQTGKHEEHETETVPFVRLMVATDEGQFIAHVPGVPERWLPLEDAEIRLEGCAMSFFNLHAEFLGIQLEVADESGIKILSEPRSPPFGAPEVPFDGLFSRGDNHRVKVRGVVTYAKKDEFFYVQDGLQTLKVRSHSTGAIAPGDEVEAVGFAQMRDLKGELVASHCRVTGHREPPAPIEEYADYDVMPYVGNRVIDLDGMARTVQGQWVRMARSGEEDAAYVMLGGLLVKVAAEPCALTVPSDWDEWHPTVRVTGICTTKMQDRIFDSRHAHLTEIGMIIDKRPGHGIVLVKDGAWRAHVRRVALGWCGVGAFALALVAALVLFARWRTMQICAGRRKAIDAERKRMAGDLHDTIEQHISGARMLLNGVRIYGGELSGKVSGALKDADEILARAKSQIREAVWNLRSDEIFDFPPEVVLRRIAKQVSSTGAVRIETFLRDMPRGMDARKFAECVYVVQEAITNAIKHGKAKRVAIFADGAGICVLNDGLPFDADKALGEAAGHFGLSSMRERAARIGMSLSFENRKRFVAVKMEVGK